jgi:hypothetical protein
MIVIGFTIGLVIGLIIQPTQCASNNIFDYSVKMLKAPQFYTLHLAFLPYYLILLIAYGLLFWLNKLKSIWLWLTMLFLYLLFGFVVFGEQFWHVNSYRYGSNGFCRWLGSEHKDLYFSVASLLSSILFARLVIGQLITKAGS